MGLSRVSKIGEPSKSLLSLFDNPTRYGFKIYTQNNFYSSASGSRTWFPNQNQPNDVVNGSQVYLRIILDGQFRTASGSPTNTEVNLRSTTGGAFTILKTKQISYNGPAFTYVDVPEFRIIHKFNIGTGTDYNISSSNFSQNISFSTLLLYKPA